MKKMLSLTAGTALACDSALLQQALRGSAELGQLLGVAVPENWVETRAEPLQYALNKLLASASEANWWTYLVLHGPDNKLVGSGGYHGRPTDTGVVELGYEIVSDYQNQGLATEFARALVANAFADARVTTIVAHTLAEANASTKVLLKNGFVWVAEINDPDDGLLWQWELKKPLDSRA